MDEQLTLEEQTKIEINSQSDSVEITVRNTSDAFQNIVYSVIQSYSLNKKVVTYYNYIEETENNNVVGRCLDGTTKQIMAYTDVITSNAPNILSQRIIDRG